MKQHEQSAEYKKFDDAIDSLLKVPHSTIKAKLEAEKKTKRDKPIRARKKPSGRRSEITGS